MSVSDACEGCTMTRWDGGDSDRKEHCNEQNRESSFLDNCYCMCFSRCLSTSSTFEFQPTTEQNYYSIAPRSCDNIGRDLTLPHAHWSILNLNVEEAEEKHSTCSVIITPNIVET